MDTEVTEQLNTTETVSISSTSESLFSPAGLTPVTSLNEFCDGGFGIDPSYLLTFPCGRGT